MQGKTRLEAYSSFIEFVGNDLQRERHLVNRRILNVFLWCFFLPACTSVTLLIFVKLNILPRSTRSYLDWLVLVFPVFYSLYILSSEVLAHIPRAFHRGGASASLAQAAREGQWRESVSTKMFNEVGGSKWDWEWILANFNMDLNAMQHRTKYLTALAGAVFFLLMHGIDSLGEVETSGRWVRESFLGWMEGYLSNFSQFVGLALFLVLLYLSGSQTYHSLLRYLSCAELVLLRKKGELEQQPK